MTSGTSLQVYSKPLLREQFIMERFDVDPKGRKVLEKAVFTYVKPPYNSFKDIFPITAHYLIRLGNILKRAFPGGSNYQQAVRVAEKDLKEKAEFIFKLNDPNLQTIFNNPYLTKQVHQFIFPALRAIAEEKVNYLIHLHRECPNSPNQMQQQAYDVSKNFVGLDLTNPVQSLAATTVDFVPSPMDMPIAGKKMLLRDIASFFDTFARGIKRVETRINKQMLVPKIIKKYPVLLEKSDGGRSAIFHLKYEEIDGKSQKRPLSDVTELNTFLAKAKEKLKDTEMKELMTDLLQAFPRLKDI